VPKASSEPLPKISSFLGPFAPLFRHSQSGRSLKRYVTEFLTDLDRKNCDTIGAAVAGASTERLQHLLIDAEWDPKELDGARVRSSSAKVPKAASSCLTTPPLPSKANPLWESLVNTAELWESGPTTRWW
jgi:hypothetical protein